MNVRVTNELAGLKPVGTQRAIASSDDVKDLGGDLPSGASCALVEVDTQAVRVTLDATDPDTTVGILLPTGYVGVWSRELVQAAQIHQGAGGAGQVNVMPMG